MPSSTENLLDTAFNQNLQLVFPPVLVQLLQALLAPNPSFSAIAGFLSMDPMLTSKILHIANSSNYGFREKVTDIERAAVAIGISDLFKLVASLTLQKKLHPVCKRKPESVFGDWRVTLWSALAAERIAGRLAPERRLEAYLAALLKDLPLFLAFCREEIPPFLNASDMAVLPVPRQFTGERAFWGHSHPELAYDIFLHWDFPLETAEAVRVHHEYGHVHEHPPLAQSIIYATRWSELLHAPAPDTGELVAFEINLAVTLGFAAETMSKFRADCAESFNLLLAQLGVRQGGADTQLHNQSLALIQNYHFLALEAVGRITAFAPQAFAAALQRQLRTFWGISTFELFLAMPGATQGTFFRCSNGKLLPEEKIPAQKAAARPGWACLHIAANNQQFGFLSLPRPARETPEFSSLPSFMHVLGLHLGSAQPPLPQSEEEEVNIRALPFAVAKLDAAGHIRDASRYFLDMFGLSQIPVGITAKGLLDARLGISLPHWDAVSSNAADAQGWFSMAPEGHYPGTPTYIGLSADPEYVGGVYLFIGDLTQISSMQAIALSHPSYLEALFGSLTEHVYLLDNRGTVFWAPPNRQGMNGKNIFSISKPESGPEGAWNPSFLTLLNQTAHMRVLMDDEIRNAVPFALAFSPLLNNSGQQYLLVAHETPPAQPMQAAKLAPTHDPITGLLTHSQFHIHLAREAERARRQEKGTGLIYCDIDDFHRINAMYGYQTGDAILRRVAGCLEGACRKGLDSTFYYGGDNFTLIVTEADTAVMETIAQAALRHVQESCHGAVTVSIGLTLVRPGEPPAPRVQLAAQACKSARDAQEKFYWAR